MANDFTSKASVAHPRIRWPEWTILFSYAALVAFAIPFHEPWADEAQAWQLARTLSLPDLFLTYVRYEGSPGLWHFFLWVLVRLHVSYSGMHWICGAIAVGATALLVLKSPLPRFLKLLLPFTYFLMFQYVVIARSYVLVPILLFSIALCWKRSPLLLALLLGLLANVALHAALISGGLAIVWLIEHNRKRAAYYPHRKRHLLWAASILLSLWFFAIWTAWPPHDLSFKTSGPLLASIIQRLTEVFRPWGLPIPFWIAIAYLFRARSSLLYMLPVAFCGLFCLVKYANMWHVGLLYPLVITLMWITWPAEGTTVSKRESNGRLALVLMAILQVLWSAYALSFDHYRAYSPDLATAKFLRPIVQQGTKIAVTSLNEPNCDACRSVGILPYFDHNIFVNSPEAFWWWSTRNRAEATFNAMLPEHPPVVIVEMLSPDPDAPINLADPKIQLLGRFGYRLTNTFCGGRTLSFRLDEKSCHLVFQYSGSAP